MTCYIYKGWSVLTALALNRSLMISSVSIRIDHDIQRDTITIKTSRNLLIQVEAKNVMITSMA